MTILEAVSLGLENKEKRKEPKKNSNRYFMDGRVADRELKVCTNCKVVWQRNTFNGQVIVKYYEEVPRYGKKHIICPRCEDT